MEEGRGQAKGKGSPPRKRAQSMQIFNQFELRKIVALRALIFCSPFLSVHVGLGAVKRIKTNVRQLREENEVERDRHRRSERGRQRARHRESGQLAGLIRHGHGQRGCLR